MNKLLEMTQKFPETELWNDSCSCKELSYALENGGSGATTNPVIVFNVLKGELPEWEDTIRQIVKDNPSYTEDDLAWSLIKAMGAKAAGLMIDQFNKTNGQRGRISFQTNAKYYQNKEMMVKQALDLASTVENSQIKLPASKAGIEAMEELTYKGVSINATVSFTVAQAIQVAEAVERGLKRREAEGIDTSKMHPVCTIMAGRVDDYLKAHYGKTDTLISSEAYEQAGVAVFKKAYRLYKERGYRTKLLVAAFRNRHHFEDFIGGDLILTIPYKWQRKYNTSTVEVKNNMDTPVDQKVLDELLTHEEFVKAYDENFPIEQFQHYGAFLATMNQFLGGYDSLIQLVRNYMVI
ncbi:MAG: transaldolase family protein [Erysipelotrichaceae bacterium]|nr:transaldolase family protein [Erysipelotrichaceae bacterium]